VKRIVISVCVALGFVGLYAAGVYLGDLVGIGGYSGWASEELYRQYQYGDVPRWLYQATEWAALVALGVGVIGGAIAICVVVSFLIVGAVKIVRGAL